MAEDRSRQVALENPDDIAYWTKRWGITRRQLEEIVARVGPDAEKVAGEIAKAAARLEPGPPSDQASGARATKDRA